MHIVLVTTSYPDAQTGSAAAGGFVADFAQAVGKARAGLSRGGNGIGFVGA